MESGSPAGKGPRRAAKAPTMSTLHRCLRPTRFDERPRWPRFSALLSLHCSWKCSPGRGTAWIRSAISSTGRPARQSPSSLFVERGHTPSRTRSSTARCSDPGSDTPGSRAPKRSRPTCSRPLRTPPYASTVTEPRSLSTAWKHISSRRYVAHCTEYASTESSGSRTYRAASPVRATSGPRDASRGATPPRSIRRYPTTSALLGSGRLPPWTKLGSVRASVHGRRSSVLRLRRFASRGDTGRRPVRLRRCLNHGQVTCWRVAGKGTRRATQTPFA
jgi:hypothetical protein